MLLHSPVKKYEVIARPLSILQNPVIQPGAPVNNFVTVTQCHELQTSMRVHVPPVPGPIQTIGDKKETLWKAFQNTLLYLGKQRNEKIVFDGCLHHNCISDENSQVRSSENDYEKYVPTAANSLAISQ